MSEKLMSTVPEGSVSAQSEMIEIGIVEKVYRTHTFR